MLNAQFQLENNLVENLEELIANTSFTLVTAASQAVQVVTCHLLVFSHCTWKPLQHVKEDLLFALKTHGKIKEIEASRSPQASNQSRLYSPLYCFSTVLRLENSNNCHWSWIWVKLVFSTLVNDGSFSLLNVLPLFKAVSPVVLCVLLLSILLSDVNVTLCFQFLLDWEW